MSNEAEALKQSLDSLRDETRRGSLVARGFVRRLLAAPSLILLAALILLLPVPLLYIRNRLFAATTTWPQLHEFINGFHEVTIGAAGVLASVAAVVSIAGRRIRTAVRKLEDFRGTLDGAIKGQLSEPEEAVKTAQASLARLTADITEARSLLAASSDRVAEAAREYQSGTGRARLLRFVRDRVANGDYARHLGLIAAIRKDFTQLSNLMVATADSPVKEEAERQADGYRRRVQALIDADKEKGLLTSHEKATLQESTNVAAVARSDGAAPFFTRIILYIDDLDRRPPGKVIDVLQAVHLLLTFPLFIVVVAVDVRWVSRSLEKHYSELIGGAESATANDYLEKIFQVPYWVRKMTPENSQNLLAGLAVPGERRTDAAGSAAATPSGQRTDPTPRQDIDDTPPTRAESDPNTAPRETATGEAGENTTADQPPDPTAQDASLVELRVDGQQNPANIHSDATAVPDQKQKSGDEGHARIAVRALELTEGERAFMQALAPFAASTPRRVLRFLNVYRVIKASLDAVELDQLEKSGGYRALMTQLAIATEAPTLHRRWLDVLGSVPRNGDSNEAEARLNAALGDARNAAWNSPRHEYSQLTKALDVFWDSALSGEPASTEEAVRISGLALLQNHGDLARRYSFSDQYQPSEGLTDRSPRSRHSATV